MRRRGDVRGGGEQVYEDTGSYTDGSEGRIRNATNHEWSHDLSEVVNALVGAGLAIESLGEDPVIDWPAFPGLLPEYEGWVLPPDAPRIPLTFSVVARKPAR